MIVSQSCVSFFYSFLSLMFVCLVGFLKLFFLLKNQSRVSRAGIRFFGEGQLMIDSTPTRLEGASRGSGTKL